MLYGMLIANGKGKLKEGAREKNDGDGQGEEKIDRGQVKKVGSDEVERYREDNAHTGTER